MNTILSWPTWEYQFLDNSISAYVWALLILVVLLITFKVLQKIVLKNLAKAADVTETDVDNVLIDIIKSVRPPFYSFLAFYFAISGLNTPVFLEGIIKAILLLWIVYLVIQSVNKLITFVIQKKFSEGEDNEKAAQNAAIVLGKVIGGVLWVVGGLFVLSNLGVNVSSMLAGVGIGGIAIAIAAQNVLGDLFSSFALYFDKPFVPGDFIVVGEHMGIVQRIGIKTTRIQALQGEEVVISNQELTSTRIQNFKKMSERRIVFNLGLTYNTPTEKLKKANDVIKTSFESVDNARLDRTHFQKFDSSSLVFEVVYHVTSSDYNMYMDIQQQVNFKIKEGLEREGLEMAYPTQTIYVAK